MPSEPRPEYVNIQDCLRPQSAKECIPHIVRAHRQLSLTAEDGFQLKYRRKCWRRRAIGWVNGGDSIVRGVAAVVYRNPKVVFGSMRLLAWCPNLTQGSRTQKCLFLFPLRLCSNVFDASVAKATPYGITALHDRPSRQAAPYGTIRPRKPLGLAVPST